MKTPIQIVSELVEQIEKCAPVDDHGHVFTMNRSYINARYWLDAQRHIHVRDQDDRGSDRCAKCGLDLRDDIHKRITTNTPA